jgi:hypothetical protein
VAALISCNWMKPRSAAFYRTLHARLTVVWLLLIIPTVWWWHNSVLWVGLISCYANAVGHFSAYQGSRAEDSGG